MAVKAGDLEHDLIESLGQTVGRQLADAAPESYQEFVRQYYHWVPAKDLADRDQADLCGAVVAHWRTARRRARGEAKVNVYNPQRERDGWTSPYTVVEIVVRRHAVHRRLGDDGAEPPGRQHRAHRPPGDACRPRPGGGAHPGARARWRGLRLLHRIGDPRRGRLRARSRAPLGAPRGRRARPRGGARRRRGLGRDARQDHRAGHRAAPPGAARRTARARTRPRPSSRGWPTRTSPSSATASTC